jgi:hypothetical protein
MSEEDVSVITESLVRQLKQVNISKDAEKTKSRTSEAWKAASKDAQTAIIELTGLAKSSVQRAYKTGSISAKLVVAVAQTLNLNPFYLTGEADEQGACSEDLLRSFLISYGYEKLLPDPPVKKRGRRTKAKQEAVEPMQPVSEPDVEPVVTEAPADPPENEKLQDPALISEEIIAYLDSLTEDDIMLLVKTMLLRAKAGGKYAEKALLLKILLLD